MLWEEEADKADLVQTGPLRNDRKTGKNGRPGAWRVTTTCVYEAEPGTFGVWSLV